MLGTINIACAQYYAVVFCFCFLFLLFFGYYFVGRCFCGFKCCGKHSGIIYFSWCIYKQPLINHFPIKRSIWTYFCICLNICMAKESTVINHLGMFVVKLKVCMLRTDISCFISNWNFSKIFRPCLANVFRKQFWKTIFKNNFWNLSFDIL